MEKLVTHRGVAAVLDRVNVDTDQIIPKQFLKRIERTGFGRFLFFDWRLNEDGTPNPDFELNRPEFAGASILIAAENFGCGSSREHAAWALRDFGFRVLIAPSFADIFYNNCFKNSMLPIVLPATEASTLIAAADAGGFVIEVDLPAQRLTLPDGSSLAFDIDPFRRQTLLEGLNDIARTLQQEEAIRAYEERTGS